VVRAYLEHHLQQQGPVSKLFYVAPFFRYEAPQAGRLRQFHQCGIELLGASSPEADAEVLALAHDFLLALGIDAVLHLNTLGTRLSRAAYIARLREYLEPQRARFPRFAETPRLEPAAHLRFQGRARSSTHFGCATPARSHQGRR
jgi:histidyl-tRNA synthetase